MEPPLSDHSLALMLLEEIEEHRKRMELKDVEDPDRIDITISESLNESLNDALDQSIEAVENVVYSIYVLAKDQHRKVGEKQCGEFQSENLV